MNAHKFVASKGIDEAKRVLEGAPEGSTKFFITGINGVPTYLKLVDGDYWFSWMNGFSKACQVAYNRIYDLGSIIDLSELKQVVESVEIVEQFANDLVGAKQLLEFSKDHKTIDLSGSVITVERLEQAIADYELVESYKGVNNG